MTATLLLQPHRLPRMNDPLDNHVSPAETPSEATCTEWVEAAWSRERNRLVNVARRMLGNREDAEDAVQEAAVRVMRHAATFDRAREFGPWSTQILVNIARDVLRRRKKVSIHIGAIDVQGYGRADESPLCLEFPDESPGPLDVLLAGELSDPVKAAIASLPERYREAFMLAVLAGCSYDEIAAETGSPVGTVRSRIHRARQMLLKRLSEEKQ